MLGPIAVLKLVKARALEALHARRLRRQAEANASLEHNTVGVAWSVVTSSGRRRCPGQNHMSVAWADWER